jgi:hypothetical protein
MTEESQFSDVIEAAQDPRTTLIAADVQSNDV